MDFQKPSLSSMADFFFYLFIHKENLKPTTTAGYRTVIADHVGSFDFDINKNLEVNRLLVSFHRERPMKDKSIPNWDLFVVLITF